MASWLSPDRCGPSGRAAWPRWVAVVGKDRTAAGDRNGLGIGLGVALEPPAGGGDRGGGPGGGRGASGPPAGGEDRQSARIHGYRCGGSRGLKRSEERH